MNAAAKQKKFVKRPAKSREHSKLVSKTPNSKGLQNVFQPRDQMNPQKWIIWNGLLQTAGNSFGTPETRHLVFVDIDNFTGFFRSLPCVLHDCTFVWLFVGAQISEKPLKAMGLLGIVGDFIEIAERLFLSRDERLASIKWSDPVRPKKGSSKPPKARKSRAIEYVEISDSDTASNSSDSSSTSLSSSGSSVIVIEDDESEKQSEPQPVPPPASASNPSKSAPLPPPTQTPSVAVADQRPPTDPTGDGRVAEGSGPVGDERGPVDDGGAMEASAILDLNWEDEDDDLQEDELGDMGTGAASASSTTTTQALPPPDVQETVPSDQTQPANPPDSSQPVPAAVTTPALAPGPQTVESATKPRAVAPEVILIDSDSDSAPPRPNTISPPSRAGAKRKRKTKRQPIMPAGGSSAAAVSPRSELVHTHAHALASGQVRAPTFEEVKRHPVLRLLWNKAFRLTTCGHRKNAADFGLVMSVVKADFECPKEVPFTVITGDKAIHEALGHISGRPVRALDPHLLTSKNLFRAILETTTQAAKNSR